MPFHPVEHMVLAGLGGDVVLELGCGSGRTAEELGKLFRSVVGVDPDFSAVASVEARERYLCAPNFSVVVGAGDGLPFPQNTFDGVVSHWALHHYRYPLAVLREAYAVLKPGGWLYLADGVDYPEQKLTPKQRNHLVFHKLAVAADRARRRDHFPPRSAKAMRKLVELAGFRVERSDLVTSEDPNDSRRENDYIKSYTETLSKLVQQMLETGEKELAAKLERLSESIRNEGIRMGPFAIIVGRKGRVLAHSGA